jgi:hypothetical protein
MTNSMVVPSTVVRRAIRLCWLYAATLALAGCWSAAPQPEPPAGSYRAQDFEIRTAETTEHMKGAAVSDDFFAGGKIRPLLGRTILSNEHQSMQVAVLSYGLWDRKFHSDPAMLGRTLAVNGQNVTIVGVMPKDFSVPEGAQLWVPLIAR